MFHRNIRLCEHELPGPACMRGLTIAFVTDIHTSNMFPPRAVERLLNQVAALRADLILWGGDYAETVAHERAFFAMLPRLSAPLGMYGVLGNNDKECLGSAFPNLRRLAERAGMRLLVNEQAAVPFRGGRILIGGTDEWKYGQPSARGFFSDAGERDLRVLLCHYPSAADRACRTAAQQPQLILSGHTHGGQINVFGMTVYSLRYEHRYYEKSRHFYVSGWREIDGARMLVSNGVGDSLLPIRIGAPRQIHRITLV